MRKCADERIARARFRTARDAGHTRDCAWAFSRHRQLDLSGRCLCTFRKRLTFAVRWMLSRAA